MLVKEVFSRRLLWQRCLLGIALALWLFICAKDLSSAIASPGLRGIALCTITILLPAILLKIGRLPVYLLAAYGALVPFNDILAGDAGATPIKLLGIAAGASLIISMMLRNRIVKPPTSLRALLILTAYAGATIFWAIDPLKALAAYGIYLNYAMLFAAITLYPVSASDVKLIVTAMAAGAIGATSYGAHILLHHAADLGARLFTTTKTYADPNEFAASLLMPLAVTLVVFARERIGVVKCLACAGMLVLFYGIAMTGSRGVSIGLATVILYLLVQSRYKAQLSVVASAAIILMLTSQVAQRFSQQDVNSADGRLDIWKVGVASLHQYWLGGAGIGNFGDAFAQYFLSTPHAQLQWDRVAHSIFIQSAVEYGLPGLLLVIAFWYVLFRELVYVQVDGVLADLCLAMRAGIVGLFISGFSLDLMTYKYTWLAFSMVTLTRTMLIDLGVRMERFPKPRLRIESVAVQRQHIARPTL